MLRLREPTRLRRFSSQVLGRDAEPHRSSTSRACAPRKRCSRGWMRDASWSERPITDLHLQIGLAFETEGEPWDDVRCLPGAAPGAYREHLCLSLVRADDRTLVHEARPSCETLKSKTSNRSTPPPGRSLLLRTGMTRNGCGKKRAARKPLTSSSSFLTHFLSLATSFPGRMIRGFEARRYSDTNYWEALATFCATRLPVVKTT